MKRSNFIIIICVLLLSFMPGCFFSNSLIPGTCMWGCGDDGAGEWEIEDGIRIANTTSSSTIRLSDNLYRMYLPGIKTTTSGDGLNWREAESIDGLGANYINPAVLLYSDGTYILIFEEIYTDPSTGQEARRFFRAQSADGISFVRTNGIYSEGAVLVPGDGDGNFISVPDLIELSDGSIRMYYVAKGDRIESAVSYDKGMTWNREGEVAIDGLGLSQLAVDPDIIELEDGRYCLFFATTDAPNMLFGNMRIRSAISDDGLYFALEEGDRIPVDNEWQLRLDPDVVTQPNGSYRMYFGEAEDSISEFDIRSAVYQD